MKNNSTLQLLSSTILKKVLSVKKFLIILFLFTGTILHAQTTIFQQNFNNGLLSSAVNGIGGYDADQDPENAITTTTPTDLKFLENGTNVETIQTNSLTADANGNCLLVQFDFTLDSATHATSGGNGIAFGLGDNPTTRSSISSTKMFAYFGFGTSSAQAKISQITPVDIDNGVTSAITVDASSAVTVSWYVNNGSTTISYKGPDSNIYTIAPNTWDLWLGNTQALAGEAADNATSNTITSFKISTGSGYQSTFDINNLSITTVTSSIATPVTLSSFTVSRVNDGALLQWKTATEINASHFDIEKSADGKSFSKLASIAARNNPTGATYSYNDNSYTGGSAYYKLEMIDMDGTVKESGVQTISASSTAPISLKYTLVKNKVEFSNLQGSAAARIIDISGTVIAHQTVSGNAASIDVSNLPAGVYFVQLSGTGINQKGLKFVKQ